VIPMIDALHAGLESVAADPKKHRTVRHAAQRGIAALNKYYSLTDESHVAHFALLLHPTFKTDYMRDQEWQDDWIEEALFLLRSKWKAQYAPRNQAPCNAPPESNTEKLYDFDRYRKQKRTTTATSDTIDQLESYLSQDSFYVDDPLAYWNDKRSSGTWPELAQMALDYLTIPATSVDVERTFSYGRQTVSLYRHSLSSQSIRASIVFGNRCKEGLVNDDELVALLREKGSR
ncbi:hypothetical protein BOTBODRAFT_93181, partial [Botryobasidium botryosum FD-172 SS1]